MFVKLMKRKKTVEQIVDDPHLRMVCPKCGSLMELWNLNGVRMWSCTECNCCVHNLTKEMVPCPF